MQSKPKTAFDIAFTELLESFCRLQIMHATINSFHTREKTMRENLQEKPGRLLSSLHNMTYRDISTNEAIFYNYQERSIEDLNDDTFSLLNYQYQWIFINSFECFEKFIKKCHSEVATKSSISPGKKDNLGNHLKYLRSNLPELNKYETRNHRNINYRTVIALIEHLRHVMVHNGGKILNIDNFKIELDKKIQSHNENEHDKNINSYLKIFLCGDHNNRELNLAKIRNPNCHTLYIDPLTEAKDWLLTYSSCLSKQLNLVFSKMLR